MKSPSFARNRSQRGQAVVEFGLCFLVFMFVMYGVMEFGRMIASYNILAGAVREGARYATVHGGASGSSVNNSQIQTVVRNWALGLDASSVNVNTTWSTTGHGPGSQVTVLATYAIVPFSGLILRNNVSLQSSSAMVISQ